VGPNYPIEPHCVTFQIGPDWEKEFCPKAAADLKDTVDAQWHTASKERCGSAAQADNT
jgi:hypothetical protein